jgi:hypothetical protein
LAIYLDVFQFVECGRAQIVEFILVLATASEKGCGLGFKGGEANFDFTGCTRRFLFLVLDVKFRVVALVFTFVDSVTGSNVAPHSVEVDGICRLPVKGEAEFETQSKGGQ